MHLVSYQPTGLANWLDDFFDDTFHTYGRELTADAYPHVDIVEGQNEYTINAEVPGLDKKDIEVKIEDGVLSIRGEKKNEVEKREKDRYYRLERSFGKFSRSFKLPDNVDANDIQASYKNGVLSLTVRKNEEAKPKAIEVKVD